MEGLMQMQAGFEIECLKFEKKIVPSWTVEISTTIFSEK
jgi:hypothetical protein